MLLQILTFFVLTFNFVLSNSNTGTQAEPQVLGQSLSRRRRNSRKRGIKADIYLLESSMKDVLTRTQGVNYLKAQLADLIDRVGKLESSKKNTKPAKAPGTVYTRWGRKTCPKSASIVYEGQISGSHYTHGGSGTNYLCLPIDGPDYDPRYKTVGNGPTAYLYGTEYEVNYAPNPFKKQHDHDAACSVCETNNNKLVTIPGKLKCPTGWTKEYSGFIMAEYYRHNSKEFICVDGNFEWAKRDLKTNHNGALLYFTRYSCGSLHCETDGYRQNGIATCVVCSK